MQLNAARHKDIASSPLRYSALADCESHHSEHDPVVQKRLRSPRPVKKRQGPPFDRHSELSVATYGDDGAQGLSQLSDIVILDASQEANLSQDYPAEVASPRGLSQEHQDAGPSSESQVMLEPPPSQPDIPLSTIHVSRVDPAANLSEEQQAAEILAPFPHGPLLLQQAMVPQRVPQADPLDSQVVKDEGQHLHPKSRATRRGPMDEMRQLVRILVKVVPHSVALISSSEEGGGGNRISEDQIKSYLDNALGEAPRPMWGLPNGWGDYCSLLFSWVLQRHVSVDQAMRCAKREPGRSWEALEGELHKLGLYPSTWPLPLTRHGLLEAARNPIIQPLPSGPVSVKKQHHVPHGVEHQPVIKAEKSARKRASTAAAAHPAGPLDAQLDKLSEADMWNQIVRLIEAARYKQGTSNANEAVLVSSAQAQARHLLQDLGNGSALQGFTHTLAAPGLSPLPGTGVGGPALPGLPGSMALVPVTIRAPDGCLTMAYQLQPVPPFGSQDGPLTDVSGLGGLPVPSMPLVVPPGSGASAFHAVQQQPRSLHQGSLNTPPHSRLTKPQPIRPRIGGALGSSAMPSAPLNGFHPDPAPQGSSSPSTIDDEDQNQAFDINSILRPTPTKPGERPRAGESQESALQSLPIHSLSGTDVAALQNSQGVGTSLSALQQAWPHQQQQQQLQNHNGSLQHATHTGQALPPGQSPQARQGIEAGQGISPGQRQASVAGHSQPEAAPAVASASPQAQGVPFSPSPRPNHAVLAGWKAALSADGSVHTEATVQQPQQQQYRPPKRKLPFSIGLAQAAKRQASDATLQGGSAPQQAAQALHAASETAKMSPSKFLSLQTSPLSQQKSQMMSSHVLLDMANQASPASKLTSQQRGPAFAASATPWSPSVPAHRPT